MINLNFNLNITVHNYSEIASSQKGFFAGLLSKLPFIDNIVHKKIDDTIAEKIRDALDKEIVKNIQKQFKENDVLASIEFTCD